MKATIEQQWDTVRAAFDRLRADYAAKDAAKIYIRCHVCGLKREDTPWECVNCWRLRQPPPPENVEEDDDGPYDGYDW